ncbi:hypothetical protein TRFO_02889 [Tritrichomonas foetus]|uniref:SPIN90/Ldb17 leucine-rich domain-containing protein n=1 Tax=Tritrichomonas foetus TaxID=1144522 RepID=A0A1J4KWK7_9EUKA|nr:hypothetical protein TRFO_02889 [Tritrichomonas foetus]|eukprot:OHT15546.1 hypothetical protein TRFO_02889 [Tritrichomonas foetus]
MNYKVLPQLSTHFQQIELHKKIYEDEQEGYVNDELFEQLLEQWNNQLYDYIPEILSFIYKELDYHKLNLHVLIKNNTVNILHNILTSMCPLSEQAFNIIIRIIEVCPQSLNVFLEETINFQDFLSSILEQNAKETIAPGEFVFSHVFNYDCAYACKLICESDHIKELYQKGFVIGIVACLKESFRDNMDNGDGSATNDIEIEKRYLDCLGSFLLNSDLDIISNQQETLFILEIYHIILKTKRLHLFEKACTFLNTLMQKNPFLVDVFYNLHIMDDAYELTQDYIPTDYSLASTFGFISQFLYYSNECVKEFAQKIDGSSIFGYIVEDINSIDDDRYDSIYTNAFILLINLVVELGEIPDDIFINDIANVITVIMNEGRIELKTSMMHFFLVYCEYCKADSLMELFTNDFIIPFFESLDGCEKDLFEVSLDTIERILSKIGRFSFEGEQEKYLMDVIIPRFLVSMIEAGDDEKCAAQQIMQSYYPDFSDPEK